MMSSSSLRGPAIHLRDRSNWLRAAVICVLVTVLALAALGAIGARLGGAPRGRAALRVVVWGLVAMGVTSANGAGVGAVT